MAKVSLNTHSNETNLQGFGRKPMDVSFPGNTNHVSCLACSNIGYNSVTFNASLIIIELLEVSCLLCEPIGICEVMEHVDSTKKRDILERKLCEVLEYAY